MPSIKNVFLDVGDLYTKLLVFDVTQKLEYDICFPSIAKKDELSQKTYSCYEKSESGAYISVGWNAAYKCSYEDILKVQSKAAISEILNKVLFDYIPDRSAVNLNFIFEEGDEHVQIKHLKELYNNSSFFIKGFVNGLHVSKQYDLNILSYSISDILKKFYLQSLKKDDQKVIFVIDIGFKNTKLFLLDMVNNHVTFHKIPHGFDYYLVKLKEYLADDDITLHPFIILKELERKNTMIDTANGKFDASELLEHIKFDLNKVLLNEIDAFLKKYYHSFLLWPDFLYITGGGAGLNGDLIEAGLTSRFDQFKQTSVEPKPGNYLLRKCLHLSSASRPVAGTK